MIYLDSASIEEYRNLKPLNIIRGVTMNPKILAKYGIIDYVSTIKEFDKELDGPINIQVFSKKHDEIVSDAIKLSSISKKVVVKIPATFEGFKALETIKTKYPAIKTNVTIGYSTFQMYFGVLKNSEYVSVFYNRIKDMGGDPIKVINTTKKLIEKMNAKTKIIVGSIRTTRDIEDILQTGADIITIPYSILKKLVNNKYASDTVDEFLSAWEELKSNKF